jgi:hypothetical protein
MVVQVAALVDVTTSRIANVKNIPSKRDFFMSLSASFIFFNPMDPYNLRLLHLRGWGVDMGQRTDSLHWVIR